MSIQFIEALKELGRVIVLAIIPVLISSLESGKVDWKVIAIVGAIAGLRSVDKYLHLLGIEKETGNGEPSKLITGLTRF